MNVEAELKRKRAELLSEIEELKLRIETTKKQIAAIDKVIALYNPAQTELLVVRAERQEEAILELYMQALGMAG